MKNQIFHQSEGIIIEKDIVKRFQNPIFYISNIVYINLKN